MKKFYAILLGAVAAFLCCSCNPEGPNNGNNGGTNPPTGDGKLTVALSTTTIQANGEDFVEFTVRLGEEVVTEGVTYYDAKTNSPIEIANHRFTTTTAGLYTLWAVYGNAISDKFSFEAVDFSLPTLPADPQPESVSFFKKMLTIYFTGTGCPNCPPVKDHLHAIAEDPAYADRFILTSAHTFNADDPAYLSQPINNACAVSSYPTLVYDMYVRLIAGGLEEDKIKKVFDDTYSQEEVAAGISASSIVENGQIVIKAAVKAAKEGDLRAGVFVLEDGIFGKQSGGTREDHNTHDDCIRTIIGRQSNSDFTGESLGAFTVGQEKEFVFKPITIKEEWKKENLKLVVYVSSYSTAENGFVVTNCAALDLNGSAEYIYK